MNLSKSDIFKRLTWADIQEWAGASILSRGKSYQRHHQVQELAVTSGGVVVAWVLGTQRYATLVDIEEGKLTSACTCPYGSTCKHAVAVVLEYLDCLEQNIEVSVLSEGDERLVLLHIVEPMAGHREGGSKEIENGDTTSGRQSAIAVPDAVHSYLEQQSKAQLVKLLDELARSHPAVCRVLQDRADLSKGTVARIVEAVRKEIYSLSAQPGWTNSWNNEGYVPDYSGIRDRLKALLAKGHADEVVALGAQLLQAGIKQVEMSQDEGETALEISQCLDIVFQALSQSSLPHAEQMLWAVQAELKDEYELCSGSTVFWEQEHAVADWNTLANKLEQLLDQQRHSKGGDSFSKNYRRDHLSDWLIESLEKAGRHEEVIPLCEREAKETGSYVRLVNHLMKADREEEAEQWIRQGVTATQKQWPGVADQLRTILREMREKQGNWLQVAAFRAGDFFARASAETFKELQKAAQRTGVWNEVRAVAMHYLETGELPQTTKRVSEKVDIPKWPLPTTGLDEKIEIRHKDFPMIETLIDIAITEKRPDEVIRWYDKRKRGASGLGWIWGTWFQEDKVAEAVADAYPDRALEIWKRLAESEIAQTKPSAYESAANFLRRIHRTLKKLGRESDWLDYLTRLRQANARKKKLLEILDGLTERRIIQEK